MIDERSIPAIGAAIARKFIARPDVLAEQYVKDGSVLWAPRKVPWTRERMASHLRGQKTYGHYVSSVDDKCKVLTFNINYMSEGLLPSLPMDDEKSLDFDTWVKGDPKKEWANHGSKLAPWMTYNLRVCAGYLSNVLKNEFGLKSTVAYPGNKGVHVFGFFSKPIELQISRQVGLSVLEASGGLWEKEKHSTLYKSKLQHPLKGTMNLSIEIFPNQDTTNGGFGNLVRLPLGKNLESTDPTFFVDMDAPLARLVPLDAKKALFL